MQAVLTGDWTLVLKKLLEGALSIAGISPEEFYEMAAQTKAAAESGVAPPPRLLYTRSELREVRKMQAIARVERAEGAR